MKEDNYDEGSGIPDSAGTRVWRFKGKLHRLGAPAFVYLDGDERWYEHGKLHRIGGPAKKWNGVWSWYEDGELHNTKGPAINGGLFGRKFWYLNGGRYSKKEWKIAVNNLS